MPSSTGAVHTFAGSPLDRAGVQRKQPDWLAMQAAAPQARFLTLHKLNAGMERGTDGLAIRWRERREIEPYLKAGGMLLFLGLDDGAPRFAVDLDPGVAAFGQPPFPGEGRFTDVRSAAMACAGPEAAILAQARSMIDWHARHGYCAVCGRPTAPAEGGYARHCTGETCKAQHFPRTDPVTIMLVVRGEDCLLGRQRRFAKGVYSALAGFMEPGETIEEAVRREVVEEVGIAVGRVRYNSSQPWPFPSSLMIGCIAEAEGRDIHLDLDELEEARWFTRAEIALMVESWKDDAATRMPPPLAIAHQLAKAWLRGE